MTNRHITCYRTGHIRGPGPPGWPGIAPFPIMPTMTNSTGRHGSVTSAATPSISGFSLPSKAKLAAPNPASALGKRSRTPFAHARDASSDEDAHSHGQPETVVGFGEHGAIQHDDQRIAAPLVIAGLKNKDWKSAARARRRGKHLPAPGVSNVASHTDTVGDIKGESAGAAAATGIPECGDTEWGLSVRRHPKTANPASTTPEPKIDNDFRCESVKAPADTMANAPSLDDEALQALLGEDKAAKSLDLVILANDATPIPEPISEYDSYKRAVAAAPEPSSLEDYERVPVEEFGAALLRGMGWNGEKVGCMKEVKRRQNLLGLGAKELKEAESLGAWVNQSDSRRLNASGSGRSARRPKAGEYMREEEKRKERREERIGGSYRREREIEKRYDREGSRERERRWRR